MINAYKVSLVEACETDKLYLIHIPVYFPYSREETIGVKRYLRDINLLFQSIYRLLFCNRNIRDSSQILLLQVPIKTLKYVKNVQSQIF